MADAKNIFSDMFNDAALTAEQRAIKMAAAIDELLADRLPGASKVQGLEPYYQFKRPITALYNTAKDAFQSLFNSSLVVHVGQLAHDSVAGGLDTDVSPESPLRKKAAFVRDMLATEKQWLATMTAPNAQLKAAYTTIVAAEEKSAHLPSGILEESRAALRLLDNMKDNGFRTSIHNDVAAILRNAEFVLNGFESYQKSEQEKKLFREHLKSAPGTKRKIPAPATARFRRLKARP